MVVLSLAAGRIQLGQSKGVKPCYPHPAASRGGVACTLRAFPASTLVRYGDTPLIHKTEIRSWRSGQWCRPEAFLDRYSRSLLPLPPTIQSRRANSILCPAGALHTMVWRTNVDVEQSENTPLIGC